MIKLLSGMTTLLIFFGAPASGQSPEDFPPDESGDPAARGGKLEADTELWDFGKIWYGQQLTRDVTVTNVSDVPVKILNVRTPCSCTTASMSRTELKPGERDVVHIAFDSTRSARHARKWVNIETNIPERKYLRIMLSGEILPIVEMEPREAERIGRILRFEPFARSVELTCVYDKPMTLRMRDITHPQFDIAFYEVDAGKTYRLDLKSKKDMAAGPIVIDLEFETETEVCPVWKMRLEGYALDRINAFPQEIYVPRNRTNASEQVIFVVYEASRSFEIKSVKANFEGLLFDEFDAPKPLPDNAEFLHRKMKIVIPNGAIVPRDGSGKVVLETNSAEHPTLEVAITGTMPEYLRALRENAAGNAE